MNSITERFPRALVEIADMTCDLASDKPHFYTMHKLQRAAWAAVDHGLRTAAEIVEAGRAIRDKSEPDK